MQEIEQSSAPPRLNEEAPRLPELRPVAVATSSKSRRVPALDGLRGLAILLVVLYHTVFTAFTSSHAVRTIYAMGQLAWSGVDLFFVLSGFLIGGILLDTNTSAHYYKTFYIRRAYRILPLYAVIVALHAGWLVVTRWSQGTWGDAVSQVPLWSYLTFTQNIWTASGWTQTMVYGVTWSLAIEEQFYLTLPLLIRNLNRRRLTWLMGAVVVGAPLLRALLHYAYKNGNVAGYVLMPCRADDLCLGVLVAILVRTPRLWNVLSARPAYAYWMVGITLAGPAWLTYRHYGMFANAMVVAGYSLLGLFYTSWLLLALTAKGAIHKILSNRALGALGVVSYCVYLIHMSVFEQCRRVLAPYLRSSTKSTHLLSLSLGISVLLIVARLSWKYFEEPMLRRGHAYKY